MIPTRELAARDISQLERKELARGAWREGQIENALLIIRSITQEEMSPAVAAACYSSEAAFLATLGDFAGSLAVLKKMAPLVDAADLRIKGTFYNQRARVNAEAGNFDAALTDYTGALALWQGCGDKNFEGAAALNLADIYVILGDLAQANQNIDHAFAVLPKDSEYLCNAYDTKAKILLAEGKTEKAHQLIGQALGASGGNEVWEKTFLETRAKIKERLIELLIPLVNMRDLDELKVQMIRNALDIANGSVTIAASMLGTSHQVVAYTAQKHNLERSKRKKSIIKHKTFMSE